MDNLRKLGIDIFVNTTIEAISQDGVRLGPGRLFDEAIVIWTAGVRTADFIQNLKAEKSPQGRLKVDEYLRVNNNCFAVGDTAYFQYQGTYLRMAVQFAISHGRCAAQNILRSIKGKKLRKYKLLDLGYIIPMANNNSCGKVFGLNLKGKVPTFLHFLMCIYRSYTMRNKVGIVRQLFRGQKLDVRGQMTEVRGQRTEDR
jgi:NADH dehydrogenase FAD-containing subunit